MSTTRYLLGCLLVLTLLEICLHVYSLRVTPPTHPLDPPFASSCRIPPDSPLPHDDDTAPYDVGLSRENATILMLARNSDVEGAASAIRSLEERFNRWFHYPVVFLNDQEWSEEFREKVGQEASGETVFAQIPAEMWGWPVDGEGREWVDREKVKDAMGRLSRMGVPYVDNENYHHMCRFYSGFFQDHPALKPYKYYWRIEPDVSYTCDIPYDPFRHMRLNHKTYGYSIALWEIGSTVPSLFRTVTTYKSSHAIPTTPLWTSMLSPSWAPLPLRWALMSDARLFHSRTPTGDAWSLCHFWSNFEVADLDFFRSAAYRSYFAALDATAGFYYERWGDAAVHSLAAALFLAPAQLHWFEDWGYRHPPFQHCPREGVGCACACDRREGAVPETCLRQLRRGVDP
ncbi:glycosyltransferase family 15 protein [Viridothelium virens]|uniref:Glycosyltransferase family 15 protein n=1 Tax=Viridothelium virens TaxID=1048519 RepID=A0A6A6HEQ3_VIRVR|nr:glycosyltransferase family 15 protein [Viridothelium virens]